MTTVEHIKETIERKKREVLKYQPYSLMWYRRINELQSLEDILTKELSCDV